MSKEDIKYYDTRNKKDIHDIGKERDEIHLGYVISLPANYRVMHAEPIYDPDGNVEGVKAYVARILVAYSKQRNK